MPRMFARVLSCAVIGLDGSLIECEVDIARAEEPKTIVVGLPDAAVQESKERVRAAMRNSNLAPPYGTRTLINLAPANLVKRNEP
jgi:magnesium chelatase family protein